MDSNYTYTSFILSAITEENPFISTSEVILWLEARNHAVRVNIEQVSFKDLDQWHFDTKDGYLRHNSGQFFSIDGIEVETNFGRISKWQQPIINQPEIGYLGFITKEFNGILYFLMQAKIEPGNVNNVQLSPTLQATKSNYSKVHKGKAPRYLEYFQDRSRCTILLDQLQSEQGARFLRKRNRNIIVQTDEDIEAHDDFIWLTLGQIKKLISYDNLVNMDTRTVISGIPLGNLNKEAVSFFHTIQRSGTQKGKDLLSSAMSIKSGVHTFDEIIAWFTELKAGYELSVKKIHLNKVKDWLIEDDQIRHVNNRFFKIIATRVQISNREVATWTQPLVAPAQHGLIAFLTKKINGIYHFLVQAKVESGNFDIVEMAPTVQCLTGNYRNTKEGHLPFLEYVLNADKKNILIDAIQSEEGGRFYQEQNRNVIIEVPVEDNIDIPNNYCWLTLNQMITFLKFNNYLNIQARSLISAISFID